MKAKLFACILLCSLMPMHGVFAQQEQPVNKQQAIEIIQQQNPGRVLSVKTKNGSYSVRVLDKQGHVRTFHVDRKTGQIKGKTR